MTKVILMLLVFFFSTSDVKAHSWYEPHCCSTRDCNKVEDDDVEELNDGSWKYVPTNTTFTKDQVRVSQDKNFHVCIQKTKVAEVSINYPRCIYIRVGY